MEHRLGAALRSGSSVLTAVVSDNTALHTAIHTAIQRAQRALQVAEGHQLTAGARKLAGRRLANFSSHLINLAWYLGAAMGGGELWREILTSGSVVLLTVSAMQLLHT